MEQQKQKIEHISELETLNLHIPKNILQATHSVASRKRKTELQDRK